MCFFFEHFKIQLNIKKMFSDCVLYILLIIFIGFIQLCNAKVSNRGNDVISCKDEQGNNVDW